MQLLIQLCNKNWFKYNPAAAETALADFKNPYSTGNSAVRDSSTAHAAKADMGYVNLDVDATDTDDTIIYNLFPK